MQEYWGHNLDSTPGFNGLVLCYWNACSAWDP